MNGTKHQPFKAFISVAVPYSSVPQIYKLWYPRIRQYLEKTSALSTAPIMLPKCGTLFTYGRADVIRTFRFPILGNLNYVENPIREISRIITSALSAPQRI